MGSTIPLIVECTKLNIKLLISIKFIFLWIHCNISACFKDELSLFTYFFCRRLFKIGISGFGLKVSLIPTLEKSVPKTSAEPQMCFNSDRTKAVYLTQLILPRQCSGYYIGAKWCVYEGSWEDLDKTGIRSSYVHDAFFLKWRMKRSWMTEHHQLQKERDCSCDGCFFWLEGPMLGFVLRLQVLNPPWVSLQNLDGCCWMSLVVLYCCHDETLVERGEWVLKHLGRMWRDLCWS